MMRPTSPEDVVRAVADGVCQLLTGRGDRNATLDGLCTLYAETTDVRHPFAPVGDTPLRTREEIRAHFAAQSAAAVLERFEAEERCVHRTSDPEVVVFEFDYVGVIGGRAFTVPCIVVARVREGVIVESRDYTDHVAFARAFGRLGRLAELLGAEAPA
jgi:ketosteroid isomerase-like protein